MKKYKLIILIVWFCTPIFLFCQNKKNKYEIVFTGNFTNNLRLYLKINNKISENPKMRILFSISMQKINTDSLVILDSSNFYYVYGEMNKISDDFFNGIWKKIPKGKYAIYFKEIYCNATNSDDNIIYIPSKYYGFVTKK